MTDSTTYRNRLNTRLRYQAQRELRNEHKDEYQQIYQQYGDTQRSLRVLANRHKDEYDFIFRWVRKMAGFLPLETPGVKKRYANATAQRQQALSRLISAHSDEYRANYKEHLLGTTGSHRWEDAKYLASKELKRKYYDEYSEILKDIRRLEDSGRL